MISGWVLSGVLAVFPGLQDPALIPGWGTPSDTDADCTIQLESGVLTITLPAAPHELKAFPKRRNAPRVLRDIESNYEAVVKVSLKADEPKAPSAAEAERGAGILIWLDVANLIRIERAQVWDKDAADPRAAVLIEYWRDGQLRERHVVSDGLPLQGDATWLRATRRIDKLKIEASADGDNWTDVKTVGVRLSSRTKIGVVATNTSGVPLEARLEGFSVKNIRLTTP